MLKLKNVLARCTSITNKGNKARRASSFLRPTPRSLEESNPVNKSMAVQLEELTDIERTQYNAWWYDLNPFDTDELDNVKTLEFLSKFGLPENKLEEIIALFRNQTKGLTKEQFFAVLRLIGHAQNDKRINPAYIHIGAPLPLLVINTKHLELTSRSSCETISSFDSTIHSPVSPFDDDYEMTVDHQRVKSFPFLYTDLIYQTESMNSTHHHHHHYDLLLTKPFKPKFDMDSNLLCNSNDVPPPPVPPQSTKPTFPKYAKRMSK